MKKVKPEKIMKLKLSQIKLDGSTQPRLQLDGLYAMELAEDMEHGAVMPPVVVYFDASDYWLADGFHRCQAAKELERKTIDAVVIEGTQRDAILHAAGANYSHGLRRTGEDLEYIVVTLLNDPEWGKWSSREIARRCNVSHTYVDQIRREEGDSSGNRCQIEYRTVQRGGLTFKQKVTKTRKVRIETEPDEPIELNVTRMDPEPMKPRPLPPRFHRREDEQKFLPNEFEVTMWRNNCQNSAGSLTRLCDKGGLGPSWLVIYVEELQKYLNDPEVQQELVRTREAFKASMEGKN